MLRINTTDDLSLRSGNIDVRFRTKWFDDTYVTINRYARLRILC
jgi:hypothetical protein